MRYLLKILKIITIIAAITLTKFAYAETLEDLGKEIGDIRQEISNIKSSNVEEAALIDQALKEIDTVMKFVNDSIDKGEVDTAILTLNYIEKAVTDVSKVVPDKFEVEKIKSGEDFSPEQMNEILEITKGVKKTKANKMKSLVTDITQISEKGMDILEVSNNINDLGIKTLSKEEIEKAVRNFSKASVEKELADQKKFAVFLGTNPKEVELTIKQSQVLQSGDYKRHQAFEIEKYGYLAGLDQNVITKGIQAIYSGDTDTKKQITSKIFEALMKNPNFNINTVPDSQMLNSMIAEDIAIEKAAKVIKAAEIDFPSINVTKAVTKEQIEKLSNQVGDILYEGKVDNYTINRVVDGINNYMSFGSYNNTEEIAAHFIAEMTSEDHVEALRELKTDNTWGRSESIAEQAARVEAALNGAMEYFQDAKYERYEFEVDAISVDEQAQLQQIYKQAIIEQSILASIDAQKTAAEAQEIYKEAETIKAFSDKLKKNIVTLKEKKNILTSENNLTEATKVAAEIKELEVKAQENELKAAKKQLDASYFEYAKESETNPFGADRTGYLDALFEVNELEAEKQLRESGIYSKEQLDLMYGAIDEDLNTDKLNKLKEEYKKAKAEYSKDSFNMEKNIAQNKAYNDWQDAIKEHREESVAVSKAAKEAASELSSSVGTTTKDAASEVTSSVSETAKEAATDVTSSVSETAKEAATEVSSSVSETAKEAATEVSESVTETAKEAATEVSSSVAETAKEAATEVSESIAETAKEAATEVSESVAETAKEAVEEAKAAVEEAKAAADEARAAAEEASKQAIENTTDENVQVFQESALEYAARVLEEAAAAQRLRDAKSGN